MKKKLWILFVLMLMVLGSFFFAFRPAIAQTDTTVFFSPDPANVYLNGTNSQVVDVWVGDVVELNAFDITVEYDPAISNLSGWETGTFLEITKGNCFQHPQHPIEPGYFQIICTQFAKPLKTGSGVLLKLTFSGLSFDSTDLTLTNPSFSAGTPLVTLYPTPINGTLNVTYNSTIKPTTLSGSFELQGRTDRGGVPVSLSVGQFVGQGPYTLPTTNVSGNNLYFPNVAMDLYTVYTAQARYLNITPAMGKQIALLANGNILPPLRLLGGNANWSDNIIDVYDVGIVGGQWGMSQGDLKPGETLNGDVNFDNVVNIRDLALVAGNYGLSSEDVYVNWTP